MNLDSPVCPVCTLYLRPGISLEDHLKSHPKQKVIEALVRLSNTNQIQKPETATSGSQSDTCTSTPTASASQQWSQVGVPMPVNGTLPNIPNVPGNHSFIYQQIMSSTSQQPGMINTNNLNPQFVTIPTVFNPQMMCPPYVYQQQQVIIHRPLPIEMPENRINEISSGPTITEASISPQPSEPSEDKDESPKIEAKNDIFESETIIEEVEQEELLIKTANDSCGDSKSSLELKDQNIDLLENHQFHSSQEHFDETDANLLSPHSSVGSESSVRVRKDLNKACQTQQSANMLSSDNASNEHMHDLSDEENVEDKPYYIGGSEEIQPNYVTLQNSYQTDDVHKMCSNQSDSVQPTEVNLIEMDGMNLVLSNDFIGPQVISQVEEYEYSQSRSERPRVLMAIGSINGSGEIFMEHHEPEKFDEEHLSSGSTNLRAHEQMPPYGDTSGHESNGGTSDIATWNQIQYQEGNSALSNSYDLIARESWDPSDGSDHELPPFQSRMPQYVNYEEPGDDDTPTISGYTEPPLMFKCSLCDESFKCLKERKLHQNEKHNKTEINEIGSKIGKKKVKKLVIKPKKAEEVADSSIDFSNKLKIETDVEVDLAITLGQTVEELPTGSENILIVKKSEEVSEESVICGICDEILPNARLLKRHKRITHSLAVNNRYKCSTCDEVFPSEPKYRDHLKIHPLECRMCGKLFHRRSSLQLHMKRHLGIKPYKCSMCDKSFLTKQKHDEHYNTHTGEAPIKCNLCDDVFRRHSNLIQHRNRHHLMKKKVKDFICHCGEIFHSKKKLAWHKEIHDPKPKSCNFCSEKFIHMSSLTRHVRRSHNEYSMPKEEKNKENAECPICKGVFLKSSIETHLKKHSGQKPYTCLICSKDFTTKWNLKLHKWTHASRNMKPFKCEICNGAFIRESDYTAHMNSHKSIRPYTCNYCGAQFIRKYNCQRHVKEHEKDKTFSCQICGKQFHRSYYLKDHMRVHSGVRPFSCHICGKTSTTKSNHNKHVRIHHAREPVSTEN